MTERVDIGDAVLYRGDCLEVLPTLGPVDAVVDSVDAVVYTEKHEESASGQPETSARGGENLVRAEAGNRAALRQRNVVSGADCGPSRGKSAGGSEGASPDGHSNEAPRSCGRTERAFQGRNAEHDLPADGPEGSLHELRDDRQSLRPPQGRESSEQRSDKSRSSLHGLPQQDAQAGVVGCATLDLITDPPYGISADRAQAARAGRRGGAALAKSTDYGYSDWDREACSSEILALMRQLSRYQIIFGGNYFALPPARCWLVWDKQNGENTYADCELAWTNIDKPVRRVCWRWHGMLRKGSEDRVHPTQKPIGVMEWSIGHLPSNDGTILDPFMGSGTTGVVCAKLGRKFIGIEIEPKYFDVACKRIEQAYAQPDLFVEPPEKPTQEAMDL